MYSASATDIRMSVPNITALPERIVIRSHSPKSNRKPGVMPTRVRPASEPSRSIWAKFSTNRFSLPKIGVSGLVMVTMLERAIEFAVRCHAGQYRKHAIGGQRLRYIVHPTRREEIVGRFGEAVSAAITLAYQSLENEVMQIPGDVQQEP